jgi:hypothetical protein
MLGSIDRWRAAREDKPTRAETIRRLLEQALGEGHQRKAGGTVFSIE